MTLGNIRREVIRLAPVCLPTIRFPAVNFPAVRLSTISFGIGRSSTGFFVFRSGLILRSDRFGDGCVRLRRYLHFRFELLEDDILFADTFRLFFLFLLFGGNIGVGAVQALISLLGGLALRYDQLRRRFRWRLNLQIHSFS